MRGIRCRSRHFATQQSHVMRQRWRKHPFGTWLRSSRIDSTMARNKSIVYSERLVDSLRKHASKATGHEVAVTSGGIQSDVHFAKMGQGQVCATIVVIAGQAATFLQFLQESCGH